MGREDSRSGGGEASSDAKLAIVEYLLASVDLAASARAGLEWLAKNTGVSQCLCAVIDDKNSRLVALAEHGIPVTEDDRGSFDLSDRDNALADALRSTTPVFYPRGAALPWIAFADTPFHAIPLRPHNAREAPRCNPSCGLLLVISPRGRVSPDLLWFGEVFGQQVSRLLERRALEDTSVRRETMLLYGIINAVSDPILLTDVDGRLTIANLLAERLFSTPEDASEGWRRAISLNNMLFSAALLRNSMSTEQPSRGEVLLVDPSDGSDLLFELLSSPVTDQREGSFLVSVLRNVTDLGRATREFEESQRRLRAAEAEVREERHRLDLIIDSVADPILVTDPAGTMVLMNAPAERLFSAAADAPDTVQRRISANGAHFFTFVSSMLVSGSDRRWRAEVGLVDPVTGESMPVEAIAGKILSKQGELTWVVTILHDRREAIEKAKLYEHIKASADELEAKVQVATAELVQQNELLRRQALDLEHASTLKSQFLANMSHEYRTPLNAILGYTNLLARGAMGALTPSQLEGLRRIDSNAQHLTAMINEILDFTRIEAGRMPLRLSKFNLTALVAEVIAEMEPIIARSGLPVTTHVAPESIAIRSDRQKVKQIVLNLLSNALKFTREGSVKILVSVSAPRKSVSIAVRDTGIGIAEEHQKRVFEVFQQIDSSTTRASSGAGLGLAICRRLAEMLDGSIGLRSAPGRGSTFTLRLPFAPRRR